MEALNKLVEVMGQKGLADALRCSPALVSHWINGRKRITGERARQIEDVTFGMVKRYELRPDLFDIPAAANTSTSEAA